MFRARQGLVTASIGTSQPQSMRLQVTPDTLILQKEELCYTPSAENANPVDSAERVVKVVRQKVGGLGISIKGGSEHKLPILISRIAKNQAADRTGQLYVGDAIIKVNDMILEGYNHDEAVEALRNAGNHVLLTVRHYGAAAPFLKGCLKKHALLDDISEAPTLRVDEKEQVTSDEKDVTPDQSKIEKRWVDCASIPLLSAHVTRYVPGTSQMRCDSFEVHTSEKDHIVIIQCDNERSITDWVHTITSNITEMLNQQAKALNKNLTPCEQILWMGWVEEGVEEESLPGQYTWHPRFLVLKGSDIYLLESPPLDGKNWSQALVEIRVYQTALAILKESECNIQRPNCFLLQTSSGKVYSFVMELANSLTKLETAWHRSIYNAVTKLGSKTFGVNVHSCSAALTLDWNLGFALYDTEAKNYLWQYRFSQLKGSSDDGKVRLKLHFQSPETREIETRELESSMLPDLLYCMHAFLTAKVVSVDPNFLATS